MDGVPGQDAGSWSQRRGDLWKTTREEVWRYSSEREVFGPIRPEREPTNRTIRAESLKTRRRKEGRVLATFVRFRIVQGHPRRSGVQRPRPRRTAGKANRPATANDERQNSQAFERSWKDGAPEFPANGMKGRNIRKGRFHPAVGANL